MDKYITDVGIMVINNREYNAIVLNTSATYVYRKQTLTAAEEPLTPSEIIINYLCEYINKLKQESKNG